MDFESIKAFAQGMSNDAYLKIQSNPDLWKFWHECKTENDRTLLLVYTTHFLALETAKKL